MSLYLDHKYAAQISSRLEKFKRKNQRIYNFRCPICKDSAKSKFKARGYFYTQKDNLKYHCHNCLVRIIACSCVLDHAISFTFVCLL